MEGKNMSPVLIRTNGPFPPGGYAFRDPKTGKHYQDGHTNFRDRVKQVLRDRMANPSLYDSGQLLDDNIAVEVSEYNCRRLNNDPRYCANGQATIAQSVSASAPMVTQGKVCISCGGTLWEAIYCKTCGGKKIKGYKCVACGAKTSK